MPRVRITYTFDEPNYTRLWIRWLSLTAASVCFVWGAIVWVEQRWYQAEARDAFEKMDQRAPAPLPGAEPEKRIHAVTPLARLEITRLHVSGFVEDGLDARTLGRAIGHSPQSAKPGQPGNIVLAAHRDTFFAGLKDAEVGDTVDIQAAGGRVFQYRVSRIMVLDPTDGWVMRSSPNENMLTLITCYPFHFIGSAPSRLVLQALPIATRPVRTERM